MQVLPSPGAAKKKFEGPIHFVVIFSIKMRDPSADECHF